MKHCEWYDNGETVETACGRLYEAKKIAGKFFPHCPHCEGRVLIVRETGVKKTKGTGEKL